MTDADAGDHEEGSAEAAAAAEVQRRNMVRTEALLDAEIQYPPDKGAIFEAQVFDLGLRGVGLATRGDWPAGTHVRFRCMVPGPGSPIPVDVEAVIRWRADGIASREAVLARDFTRYGLQFIDISSKTEDEIMRGVLTLQAAALRRARGED